MAFVREIVFLGIVAMIAVLALKGQLKEENALIGVAMSMLARSMPPDVFRKASGLTAVVWLVLKKFTGGLV